MSTMWPGSVIMLCVVGVVGATIVWLAIAATVADVLERRRRKAPRPLDRVP